MPATPDAPVLLHMVPTAEWSGAPTSGTYEPPSYRSDGYVHLSTPQQVHLPANALYAGRGDLLLLCLDPARLTSEVRWEKGFDDDPEDMRFPHLYGPLDLAAVFDVRAYRPDEDGAFGPPVDVPLPD